MTRAEAFAAFGEAARRIWSNADTALRHVALSDEPPPRKIASSLVANASPRVIGSFIVVPSALRYQLRLADRLLDMDDARVRAIMAHEAVHLGIQNHGAEFRRVARAHGASLFEESGTSGRIRVEKKIGARYQPVREFTDESEATAWAREQQRNEPGSRWRLTL